MSNAMIVSELLEYIPDHWKNFLGDEIFKQPFWSVIVNTLNKCDYTPCLDEIFNAFRIRPSEIKVVIVGQDPYPTEGIAHGYSFSIREGSKIPPSFKNIITELSNEYSVGDKTAYSLEKWVDEGVFLLNSLLTTEIGKSKAHTCWEQFTSFIIKKLSFNNNILFICWGSVAKNLVKSPNMLFSGHPSPLNRKRDFIGNEHFLRANRWLIERNILPIRWLKIFRTK
jgi:uracil-DNA glycosylase